MPNLTYRAIRYGPTLIIEALRTNKNNTALVADTKIMRDYKLAEIRI